MRAYIKDAQWAAVRELAEGALPTHARLAASLGVGMPAISHRAARENWSLLDCRARGVRAAHAELARLAGRAEGRDAARQDGPGPRGSLEAPPCGDEPPALPAPGTTDAEGEEASRASADGSTPDA